MSQDRQLQEAVLSQLMWEPSIDPAHIGVSAKDGVVSLTGYVETYLQKHAAEKAAERVRGVKAVAQELTVHLPLSATRNDEDIAHAAVERLAWEVSLPKDAITVEVERGWVTLSGEVEWQYQKESAERQIRSLAGVVAVTNETTIKPRADAADISANIDVALHRGWFDPTRITVTTKGSAVTLSGYVDSPEDRRTVGATAWGSPGVSSVENDLLIA